MFVIIYAKNLFLRVKKKKINIFDVNATYGQNVYLNLNNVFKKNFGCKLLNKNNIIKDELFEMEYLPEDFNINDCGF